MAEDRINKARENSGAAKQNSGLPLLPIAGVLIILIGALLLWQSGAIPGLKPGPARPDGNNTTVVDPMSDPSARILLQYMAKQSNLPDAYSIVFTQPQDGQPILIRLDRNGAAERATVVTSVSSSSFTWIGNDTVVCEQSGSDEQQCAMLNDSSALKQDADQLSSMFPQNSTDITQQVAVNQKLIQYRAFKFVSAPQKVLIANRSCENMTYTLDYSQLDGQELANIQQIQPAFTMPNPQIFDNFHLEQCMDDEYGIALYSKLDYRVLNTDGTYAKESGERELVSFSTNAPNITLPTSLVNFDEVQSKIVFDQDEVSRVAACLAANTTADRNLCIRQGAIEFNDARLCNMSSNETAQGDCIIKMATQSDHVTPSLCELAGTARSECYANAAYLKNNISYCQMVTDAALKAQCISAIKNQPAANNTNMTNGGNSTATANKTGG